MGRYYRRPIGNTDYGTVATEGPGGNTLGDNNHSTGKQYHDVGGSICTYAAFDDAVIPAGRDIIAVRACHMQVNGGIFNVYNGWPESYLRIDNKRANESMAYKQDGLNGTVRQIDGPPLYKPGINGQPGVWTEADVNQLTTEIGTKPNPAPDTNKKWCWAKESMIAVVYHDAVPVPTISYPANGATIATSSVNFAAKTPAPQPEQPVQAIIQVTQEADFSGGGISTFIGGLNSSTDVNSLSNYTSNKLNASYTNLGPGFWRVRVKARDAWGRESAWSSTTNFTISHPALPVPTLAAPAPSSTAITPYMLRSGNLPTPTGDRKVGILFQFSKASDFSSGVVAWANVAEGRFDAGPVGYDPKPDYSTAAGLFGYKVSPDDPTQYLSQGTWYARLRSVDRWGQFSAWSPGVSFLVKHNPLPMNQKPALGAKFDQNATPVRWTMGDPWSDDLQTAYRMVVTDASMNILQDTGKVSSSVSEAIMNLGAPHLQESLKYAIWTWDLDDAMSEVETYNDFVMSVSPVITLPFPAADEAIVTGQPVLNWSCVFSRVDVVQKSYEIKFYDAATGVIAYQTGKITSTATSWSAPIAILKNLTNYQLALTITDSDDLASTLLRNFTTNFIRPAEVFAFVETSQFTEGGYVELSVPDVEPDAFFTEWRVYRRKLGELDWTLALIEEDITARTFRDWLVHGNGEFQWTVTQAATRFGSTVESEFDEDATPQYVVSEYYWLIDPDNELNNVKIHSVVGDDYTDEQETVKFVVVGRGRHVNYGTRLGKTGSLSIHIRGSAGMTASQQVEVLRELYYDAKTVLLRDPFGNRTRIAVGDPKVSRMPGVGNEEYGDIELPYEEVV